MQEVYYNTWDKLPAVVRKEMEATFKKWGEEDKKHAVSAEKVWQEMRGNHLTDLLLNNNEDKKNHQYASIAERPVLVFNESLKKNIKDVAFCSEDLSESEKKQVMQWIYGALRTQNLKGAFLMGQQPIIKELELNFVKEAKQAKEISERAAKLFTPDGIKAMQAGLEKAKANPVSLSAKKNAVKQIFSR